MTEDQRKAFRCAIHDSYMLAEVLTLCGVGVEHLVEAKQASSATSALYLLADIATRISENLDRANPA